MLLVWSDDFIFHFLFILDPYGYFYYSFLYLTLTKSDLNALYSFSWLIVVDLAPNEPNLSRYLPPFHLEMETDPVSDKLCSFQNTLWWTELNNINHNIISSQPFKNDRCYKWIDIYKHLIYLFCLTVLYILTWWYMVMYSRAGFESGTWSKWTFGCVTDAVNPMLYLNVRSQHSKKETNKKTFVCSVMIVSVLIVFLITK